MRPHTRLFGKKMPRKIQFMQPLHHNDDDAFVRIVKARPKRRVKILVCRLTLNV